MESHRDVYETWEDVPAGTMVRSKRFYAVKPVGEGVPLINSTNNPLAWGWVAGVSYRGPFWPIQERL